MNVMGEARKCTVCLTNMHNGGKICCHRHNLLPFMSGAACIVQAQLVVTMMLLSCVEDNQLIDFADDSAPVAD